MCLAETYSFGYSLNTTHIKPSSRDYDFVEDNQVFTLEKRNGSEIKCFTQGYKLNKDLSVESVLS